MALYQSTVASIPAGAIWPTPSVSAVISRHCQKEGLDLAAGMHQGNVTGYSIIGVEAVFKIIMRGAWSIFGSFSIQHSYLNIQQLVGAYKELGSHVVIAYYFFFGLNQMIC